MNTVDAGLSPIVAGAWRMAEWQLSPPDRLRWIEQNLELGITSFDHADIYGGYQVETLFVPRAAFMKLAQQYPDLAARAADRIRRELSGYLGAIESLKPKMAKG